MDIKKSKTIIWLILGLLVLSIGGFIVYDKVIKGEDLEDNKQEDKIPANSTLTMNEGVAEIVIGEDYYKANKTIGEVIEEISEGNALFDVLLDYSKVISDLQVKIMAKISRDGDMPILDEATIYLKDKAYKLDLADYRTFDALKVWGFNGQVALITDNEYFSSLEGYNLILKVYDEQGMIYEDKKVINAWYKDNTKINSSVELGEDYIIYAHYIGDKDKGTGEKLRFYSKDKWEVLEEIKGDLKERS